MEKRRKLLVGGAFVLVVAAVGTGVGLASGGDDDKPLTGSAYQRATRAALDHLGSGSVVETEVGDDGAAYGVEIRTSDGSVVEVSLDSDFEVVGTEQDDDAGEDPARDDD